MRAQFSGERREELLDGVMKIIAKRGFSDVTISEIAGELHCSASSLYKIAPSKDSLVVVTITRWGEHILEDMEVGARKGKTASEKARNYYRVAVESIRPLSHDFRSDTNRFESARLAYAIFSDRFLERFVELLDDAVKSGDIRPLNTKFLGLILRQIALLMREDQLSSCGINAAKAMSEVEKLIWDGVRCK